MRADTRGILTAGALALGAPLWAGCGGDVEAGDVEASTDAGVSADAAAPLERAACEGGGRGSVKGCAEGWLVDEAGAPMAGVRVAACTPATCITGTTGADGRFAIQGLPVEPHKFEALAVPQGRFATVFFADVTGGRMVGPERPVVLHPLPEGRTAFDPAAGGTLSLADGALVLEAAPGALSFPIGTAGEGAAAAAIPVETLPEYDAAPWAGREEGSFAVVVHPFPLKIAGDVSVTLAPPADAGEGPWDLHAVNGSTGRIERAGALEADAEGRLRLASPATLPYVTVLVAVPR
jgi:hypothetical protein